LQRYIALGLLAVIVGQALPSTALRADDGKDESFKVYEGPPNLYGPYPPELDTNLLPSAIPPELRSRHPLANWAFNHPWYCVTHHNNMGCGSLKSDCVFIFGSCREFFVEPCYQGPSPYTRPPRQPCPGCTGW